MDSSILNAAIINLLISERFYAELILHMNKVIDTELPAVAAVNITDTVNLYIQPYMWSALSLKEQVGVLKHECFHIMHNHIARFKALIPDNFDNKDKQSIEEFIKTSVEFKIGNIAADYANNEYIPELPKEIKIFDNKGSQLFEGPEVMDEQGNIIPNPNVGKPVLGKLLFVDDWRQTDKSIEKNQHMEYYYEKLKQEQQNSKSKSKSKSGPGNGDTVDHHAKWFESDLSEEVLTEKIKKLVNKAAEQAKGAGSNLPPQIEELISRLNYKPRNWKNDLRQFVARSSRSERESTRKRRNRRYGIDYPGYKFEDQLHLILAIDDSGSMHSELLSQILAECDKIKNENVKITVIVCDDKIHQIKEYEPGDKFDLSTLEGRGGTAFRPVFDKASEMEIDGLIYFSDMDNFDVDAVKRPKFPVLWADPEGCMPRYDWGKRTTITINKKKA